MKNKIFLSAVTYWELFGSNNFTLLLNIAFGILSHPLVILEICLSRQLRGKYSLPASQEDRVESVYMILHRNDIFILIRYYRNPKERLDI